MSVEDVKLCARRSASLMDFITAQGEQLRAEKEAEKEGGGAEEGEPAVGEETTGQDATKQPEKKSKGKKKRT